MNPSRLPRYHKLFDESIIAYYPGEADTIINNVKDTFVEIKNDISFIKTSGNPMDKRLEFCAYFLALIKVLDKKGETYSNIRTICLEVARAYVQPKNKIHAFAKKMIPKILLTPPGRMLIKVLQEKVRWNKSKEGFVANIITNKDETYGIGYGVDILECGICKLFQKHNYSRYASILCEVDEVTSKLAGLEMIRTGTIATGAKKCDFRYKFS